MTAPVPGLSLQVVDGSIRQTETAGAVVGRHTHSPAVRPAVGGCAISVGVYGTSRNRQYQIKHRVKNNMMSLP